MNNQSIFQKHFMKLLDESNMAGPGGVFGGELQGAPGKGGSVGNTDWYAPDDTRMPKILGATTRKRRKKRKKRKTKKEGNIIPVIRRNFPERIAI